ncbi:GntR family transcriptional regulator [Saccharibacillus sp. CPCC 101409]|uniref:GntR family transcriptional regulator n=1 Tax=Saccharibacillus sp. CPCC 101409 TaxID=3058041 RepID=UPI0026719946|nr:GntR family transcriptional regulator [Saccharibacillus sp. CPCC 101409]MDO3413166.1 GntR family transcriptional regulator [Saccharibacillus sp. CPCC 101409]
MTTTRSKQPLYLKIHSILKDRILHGQYPLDSYLPPEPRLEEEFAVSKITVRNAVKLLVQEGYLETSSGKGTRVVRNTSTSKRSTWKRFTEILVEEGHRIGKRTLQAEIVQTEPNGKLREMFGESCLRVERLYSLDGAPYIHYTHYLPARMGDPEHAGLQAHSLYGWLEEQGIAIAKLRDEFSVGAPGEAIARTLEVEPGAALLKRRRFAHDELGRAAEYSEGYYRDGMHPYVVNYDV